MSFFSLVQAVPVTPSPKPAPHKAAKAPKAAPSRRASAISVDTHVSPIPAPQLPPSPHRVKREAYPSPKEEPSAGKKQKARSSLSGPPVVAKSKVPGRAKVPRDDGTQEQLKFCSKILSDMFKKQYYEFAFPFYDPVGECIHVAEFKF